jgi:hypothetical protein
MLNQNHPKQALQLRQRLNASSGRRGNRPEPNPLAGNFILMPSLLDYLSPDLTLPEQYFSLQQNDDGMGAEKALMYAVLKDGIRCFYKHVGATRRKYRKMSDEAEEWLMEDTWDYPFSFRVICDSLGIDADCLRAKLLNWKDAELERRRLTGDTKSIQVGRSPFPSPIDELAAADSCSETDEDDDAYFGFSATDEDDADESDWGGYESVSLEELRLEEVVG